MNLHGVTRAMRYKAWDVYSLGMILWYLWYRQDPFLGYHPHAMIKAIRRGARPSLGMAPHMPASISTLISRMWAQDVLVRPDARVVQQDFQSFVERDLTTADLLRTQSAARANSNISSATHSHSSSTGTFCLEMNADTFDEYRRYTVVRTNEPDHDEHGASTGSTSLLKNTRYSA